MSEEELERMVDQALECVDQRKAVSFLVRIAFLRGRIEGSSRLEEIESKVRRARREVRKLSKRLDGMED